MYTFTRAEYIAMQREVRPTQRVLFLFDDDGSYPFADINPCRVEGGIISFIGEPITVSAKQSYDWKRAIRNYRKVREAHGSPHIDTWQELEAFANLNRQCHHVAAEYARVQRAMVKARLIATADRLRDPEYKLPSWVYEEELPHSNAN